MKLNKELKDRVGKDRWLVSYADFITLFFAFFVVMYAISSINYVKYRNFSKSLEAVFPEKFRKMSILHPDKIAEIVSFIEDNNNSTAHNLQEETETYRDHYQDIDLAFTLKKQFNSLIEDKKIRLRESADWLEIEVGSNLLFGVGSSFLNNEPELIIKNLATILQNNNNTITVEVFADNIPIHNNLYPSNWELSADRAAAVANALINDGVSSKRLTVTGYGENFSIADNDTLDGRTKNRRIIIFIEKENKRKNIYWILV